MISLDAYKGKTVAVLGLGKAGLAAVDAFEAAGATVLRWDDKQAEALDLHHFSEWDWASIDALIMSPGIPLTHPKPHPAVAFAHDHNVRIIGEVDLLAEAQPDATYVGITGTNGKSTTTALIAHILQTAQLKIQVGGNLGVPALALEPLESDGIYIIEMSSYQLDLCDKVRFNVACFLNLSPDHIDRHGDMAGYIAAKSRIFRNQTSDDVAVIGVDDADSAKTSETLQAQRVVKVSVEDVLPLDLSVCAALQGTHNIQNAYVAYHACKTLGIDDATIQSAMESFGGLAHRMNRVLERDGVLYINDSKATNADSAAKALDTYDNIYWIVGGIAKAGGIESLTDYFPKVKKAYVIGQDASIFAETLQAEGVMPFEIHGALDGATRAALEDAMDAGGGVVLLSPAAASFDQFASFEKRGDLFVETVQRLTA